ncbi:MAG: NAD(P)/FAD-dependent oxidoreductase [Lachnospiraceae bacterium]
MPPGQSGYLFDLGNGAAGIQAAAAIRERDATGTILMVSEEVYPAYNRPMLTKALSKGFTPEEIAVYKEAWYTEKKIIQLLGKTVAGIRPLDQKVVLTDGIELKYDKLIYAMGASCFVPPIPGTELSQVIAIRNVDDVKQVQQLLPETKEAVVIGGGVLGLEAAWELKQSGCQVTVLELAPQLMGRQLDEQAGALLKEIASDCGIDIHTGVQIQAIEGNGKVEGVRLGDQTLIKAQLVIVSCGVRANTEVASRAGIAVERAVTVNDHMRTNLPNIFACGDCAQFQGVNYALWTEAASQGMVAGANAAGESVAYTAEIPGLSFHGMNTALFAIGDTGKNPDMEYQCEEKTDEEHRRYEKYYYAAGQLKGGILIGDLTNMGQLMEHVK